MELRMRSPSRKYIESLPPRSEPYFQTIGRGLSIGVRKLETGFSYVVRIRVPGGYVFDSYPSSIPFEQVVAKAKNLSLGKVTFQQAKESYLKGRVGIAKAFTNLEQRLALPYFETLNSKLVQELTAQELKSWLDSLKEKNLKPGTINKLLTHLKSVLNHSYKLGQIESDRAWRSLSKLREQKKYLEIVSEEEERRILSVSDSSFALLVRFALDTGMRYGELISLRWDSIFPDRRTILLKDTKSGKERLVPYRIDTPPRRGELVFLNEYSAPFIQGYQSRKLHDICKKLCLRNIRFHDFRHTWTTRELMKGTPIQVVSHLLGHSSVETTEKNYKHLVESWIIERYLAVK